MSEQSVSPVLEAHNILLHAGAAPITTSVSRGEIVGLAGLDGHGQEEFLETLCGLRAPLSGSVIVRTAAGDSKQIRDFQGAVRAGVAYLPRNRKTQGILPSLSVLDNFGVSTLDQSARFGFVNRRLQRQRLQHFRERLSMVFASPGAPITSLSGGNQQKVLLARWMAAAPRVMLLNDPTRGVDLPTRLKLYEVFRELAAQEGTALVLLSTEIEEVLQLCQRTLVFREGSVFAELDRAQLTMSHVIAAMFGRTHGDE